MYAPRPQDDLTLIDAIYEASVLPIYWPNVIAQLCTLTECWGGALITIDSAREMRWMATPAYEPVLQLASDQRMQERNVRPARSLARMHAGWLSDLDVFTPEEHARDPIYNELLRPHGIGWSAGSVILLPTGEMLVFDLNRALDTAPFERATLNRLDALRPHMARAALISAQLGLQRERERVNTLAALGIPAASLGRGGRILAANDLLQRRTDVFTTGGADRFVLRDPAANALVHAALDEMAGAVPSAVRSVPIRATEDRPAYIANLVPIRREAHDLFPQGTALVTLTPVEAPEVPTRRLLHGLFDLTPAEAKVAQALMEGLTVDEAATRLGLAPATIRTHMKRIFSKTGTSRQAELVLLLLGTTPYLDPR